MKRSKRSKKSRLMLAIIAIGVGVALVFASPKVLRIQVGSEDASFETVELPNFSEIDGSETPESIRIKSDKSVILFTASWCGSCQALLVDLKQLAEQNPSINFYIADLEADRDLAALLSVGIVPSLVFVDRLEYQTLPEIRIEQLTEEVNEFALLGIL